MFFLYFLSSLFLTFLLTAGVRFVMRTWKIVDMPKTEKRKIHKKKIPLGGGLAIFFSFFIFSTIAYLLKDVGDSIPVRILIYVFVASVVLIVGGF